MKPSILLSWTQTLGSSVDHTQNYLRTTLSVMPYLDQCVIAIIVISHTDILP